MRPALTTRLLAATTSLLLGTAAAMTVNAQDALPDPTSVKPAALQAPAAAPPADEPAARPAEADPTSAPSSPAKKTIAPDESLTLSGATATVKNYGLRAFWALVVVVVAYQLIKVIIFVLDRLSERSAQRRLFYKRLVPIVRLVLWAFTVVLVVRGIFNVDAQGLLAAAAAIGVAIGFAAQDILKNIFGGLVIVADRPFQVGDKIEVGGTYGEVLSIGLRSTRIQTPDDNLVSVPNAQVVDGQVSNANSGELNCQVVTDLYLPGSADEALAKRIAYQAAASSRYVYLGKPIVVIVKDEYTHAHVLHLRVKAYVLDTRYEFLLLSDITERSRAEFRRVGLLRGSAGAQEALPGGDWSEASVATPASPS